MCCSFECSHIYVTGPRPDWDPDVVAALDEALDLDDPSNILDDDFISKASVHFQPGVMNPH